MAKTKAEVCNVHLNGLDISEKEARELLAQSKAFADEKIKQQYLRDEIVNALNEKSQIAKEIAYDNNLAEALTQEIVEGSESYVEFLKKKMDFLFGRNSVDTARKKYRDSFLRKLDTYTNRLGAKEISLSDVTAGSDLEKNIFKKVKTYAKKAKGFSLDELNTTRSSEAFLKRIVGDNPTDEDRLALAIVAYNEFSRQFVRKYGVSLNYYDGFVAKRTYSPAAIKKLGGVDEWAEYLYKRLDINKSFGVPLTKDQAIERLKRTGRQILENEFDDTITLQTKTKGKRKSTKQKREWVFKDDDVEYQAFRDLGARGLTEQLTSGAYALASDAVKTSRLGFDPKTVDVKLNAAAKRKFGATETSKNRFMNSYREARIKQAMGDLTGETRYAPSSLSTFGTAIKLINNVGKLGNSITTAMLDPLDASRQVYFARGGTLKSYFTGMFEWHRNFILTAKNQGLVGFLKGDSRAARELEEHLGTLTNFISTASSMRMIRDGLDVGEGVVAKGMARHASTAMKLATFLPQQMTASMISTGLLATKTMTRIVDDFKAKGFDKLSAFEKDTLKQYKISPAELDVLAKVERYKADGWGGQEIISGKQIRALLDVEEKDFQKHLGELTEAFGFKDKVMKEGEIITAQEQTMEAVIALSEKFDNFIADFVSKGTPSPELGAKTALFKATGNEYIDFALSIVTQFMDTPVHQLIAFGEVKDKLMRVHKGDKLKVGAELTGNVSTHIMMGTGLYLMHDALLSAALNKESRLEKLNKANDKETRQILFDVFGRTSAVPFLFEAMNNHAGDYYGQNVLDTFGGPGYDLIQDTLNVTNGNTSLETFGKRHAPNAWFIQGAKNWMED